MDGTQPHDRPFMPPCRLVGTDGNVVAIIGMICQTLKQARLPEQADAFMHAAFACHGYDEVLLLCSEYVEVS